MTRINVVPVWELCDKHLLAEFRELKRIPNKIRRGKFSMENQPTEFKLGTGHVKFFYDKLLYLYNRYEALFHECIARGFNVNWAWPELNAPRHFWCDYVPTAAAVKLNRARINERMPVKAKWTVADKPKWAKLKGDNYESMARSFKESAASRRGAA